MLNDRSFWDSLLLTGKSYLNVVPIEFVLGLGVAMLLHKPGWGLLRNVTRVSLVVPLATTYALVWLIGRLMVNRDFGVVNPFMGWLGMSSSEGLGNSTGAFVAIVVMDIEEAARLETKSYWASLRYVQLPYLLPSLMAVLILRSADVLSCSIWGWPRRRRSFC